MLFVQYEIDIHNEEYCWKYLNVHIRFLYCYAQYIEFTVYIQMYLYACLYKKRMQFPDVEIIACIIPVKNELSERGNWGIQ